VKVIRAWFGFVAAIAVPLVLGGCAGGSDADRLWSICMADAGFERYELTGNGKLAT